MLLSELSAFLQDSALVDKVRIKPTAFTRDRKLTLPRLAAMMISGMCSGVQAELDGFFGRLQACPGRIREVSAQAFSKARMGFSARLFELAGEFLLEKARPVIDCARWNGRRVVAADASRLRVSTRKTAALAPDHYVFAMFLPGTELTLHASLHPANGAERDMLLQALDVVDPENDLFVLDRGYVGNAMVATLAQRGFAFCLRVDASNWNCVKDFVRANETERLISLPATSRGTKTGALANKATTVRLIRDVTPNGKMRVLMTNLIDAQAYPAAQFGALYHQRWRVEECFKRIKHRLRLEATTGLTYLALQQDFAAKIFADNLSALLSGTSQTDAISQANTRPNRTYAFGALKLVLAGCLFGIKKAWEALPDTLKAIAQNRCRIQPGRSYPRPRRVKPHLHMSYKAGA